MTEVLRGSALRRGLLVMGLALMGLFATAAIASAATVTLSDDGLASYTAAEGFENSFYIFDSNEADESGEVTFRDYSGDVITEDEANCADVSADYGQPAGTFVECTGVTALYADTGDEDDTNGAWGVDDIPAELHGGPGNDYVEATYAGGDRVFGDAGNDFVRGGYGDDFVSGGDGDDDVNGGRGADEVHGDAGEDLVVGGPGRDGADGEGPDVDRLFGDDGDDRFVGWCPNILDYDGCGADDSADEFNGGAGNDTVIYAAEDSDGNPTPISVTIDDVANDGYDGDNVRTDVEHVNVLRTDTDGDLEDGGDATVVGSAATNGLSTGTGNDTVTGGPGNDFIQTFEGSDTVNAVDGFADYVDCGEGPFEDADTAVDVANVDQFDTTVNCEDVNVTQVGELASENNPPSISWVTPAANGGELANGTLLEVNATDPDDGVQKVIFLAGNRILCEDTTAPYQCTFTKTGADVGKATIVAIAIDNAQQTATALRFLDVDRFEASLSSKVSPKRDTSDPRRFRVSGRLTLPAGVSAEEGCQGSVIVRFKAGKKTISTKRPKLRDDCTYRMKKRFTLPERFDGANKLRVFARFAGNDVIAPDAAKRKKVTVNG